MPNEIMERGFLAMQAEIARGARGVLLVGPPGIGLVSLARRAVEILPTPDATHLERIRHVQFRAYATAGLIDYREPRAPERPFRAPHHTVSEAALVGAPGPYRTFTGEVALAVGGALLLDSLTDFPRRAIEALAGRLNAMDAAERPFIVATALPCPCGFLRHSERVCACGHDAIARWAERTGSWRDALRLTRIEVG